MIVRGGAKRSRAELRPDQWAPRSTSGRTGAVYCSIRALLLSAALADLAGCSAPFQSQAESGPLPKPAVRFDAAWFTENGSRELAQRLKEERRQQIETTVARRAEGQVGLPLVQSHAIEHRSQPVDQPSALTISDQQNSVAEDEGQHEASSRGETIIRLAGSPAAK